jgi:hypothetical protein
LFPVKKCPSGLQLFQSWPVASTIVGLPRYVIMLTPDW